jgi:hypothetical protein
MFFLGNKKKKNIMGEYSLQLFCEEILGEKKEKKKRKKHLGTI